MAASHGLVPAATFPLMTSCVEDVSSPCCAWLPRMDSNHDKQIQNLQCYRYTTRQSGLTRMDLGRHRFRE
jgi:hypothetical protein